MQGPLLGHQGGYQPPAAQNYQSGSYQGSGGGGYQGTAPQPAADYQKPPHSATIGTRHGNTENGTILTLGTAGFAGQASPQPRA